MSTKLTEFQIRNAAFLVFQHSGLERTPDWMRSFLQRHVIDPVSWYQDISTSKRHLNLLCRLIDENFPVL